MAMYTTPSLAAATATRVDSACKHMQQCRVSYDHMLDFVGSASELEQHKMQYCVHKDEMTIGVSRPWRPQATRKLPMSAYPRVISNLGNITTDSEYEPAVKMIKYLYHFSTSIQKRKEIIDQMSTNAAHTVAFQSIGGSTPYFDDNKGQPLNLSTFMSKMYDFYPVGFSTTLGYAHPNSGDTMTTVMIGGLRTVMNGDFEVFAGDIIQWYWTFERRCFRSDGSRNGIVYANAPGARTICDGNDPEIDFGSATIVPPSSVNPDPYNETRRHYNDFQYGVDKDKKGAASKALHVARIKPYIRDDDQPRLYDWVRVFAVAISSARPNELVDIKIGKQSM